MLETDASNAVVNQSGPANVPVPGDALLTFNTSFEIRSGQTTTFVADFTPVGEGRSYRYVLQPAADEVDVDYERQTGSGRG